MFIECIVRPKCIYREIAIESNRMVLCKNVCGKLLNVIYYVHRCDRFISQLPIEMLMRYDGTDQSKCSPEYIMIQVTKKPAKDVMKPSLVNSHTPPNSSSSIC